jgi:hypothetical protein
MDKNYFLSLKEALQKQKIAKQEYDKACSDYDKLLSELKNFASNEIQNFDGLSASLSSYNGKAVLLVHSFGNLKILETNKWGVVDPEDCDDYGIPLQEGTKVLMTFEDFDKKMKEMAASFEASLKYSYLKIRREGGIQTLRSLKLLFKDSDTHRIIAPKGGR